MSLVRQRPKNEDDRILPLINVVFLLLIFFMLAGRLAATDPFQIDPPVSASEGLVTVEDLLVQVGVDGRLALNGQEMGEAQMAAAVAERLADGTPAPVRLKADGTVEATRVVAIMELLREAGVASVQLLTLPAGDG
ncbi:biopolymer transporter ExbD [Thalassobaculum sp. OXR-137]|uniref:ExbD/TolR family protein n=1 Tax=Thalassobaculum sp. OXR-137 TaxID=3100173 RepID=UPI002AC8B685|nr:biopolymer transporter ExbD [Thalassobaculum sp. OXR-137]WPZ35140.1 biopolymer transporter ExbD [Thalassobaculum sp. OXR-137]